MDNQNLTNAAVEKEIFLKEREFVAMMPIGRSACLKLADTEPLLKRSRFGRSVFWKKSRVLEYLELS